MGYLYHIAVTPRADGDSGNIAVVCSVDFPAYNAVCPHIQAAVEMVAPKFPVCSGKSVIGFYRHDEPARNLFLAVIVHALILGTGHHAQKQESSAEQSPHRFPYYESGICHNLFADMANLRNYLKNPFILERKLRLSSPEGIGLKDSHSRSFSTSFFSSEDRRDGIHTWT